MIRSIGPALIVTMGYFLPDQTDQPKPASMTGRCFKFIKYDPKEDRQGGVSEETKKHCLPKVYG